MGYDDRAKGSFRKALNNHQKADIFNLPYNLNVYIIALADNLANAIMNGGTY